MFSDPFGNSPASTGAFDHFHKSSTHVLEPLERHTKKAAVMKRGIIFSQIHGKTPLSYLQQLQTSIKIQRGDPPSSVHQPERVSDIQ
jgi:hypothetical protein